MDEVDAEEVIVKQKKINKPRKKQDDYEQRLKAAERITAMFKAERYMYVGCCVVAVLLLIFCICYLLWADKSSDLAGKIPVIISLFGSGGAITYSTGRLIVMWNKIIDIVLHTEVIKEDNENGN